MEPDPNNKYYRDCVVSYWYNANLKKIMWKLRGTRLRGALLMVMEYREFVRRIDVVDGLAGDKSVVLRDIQLCKSLIEYLDKKERLWGHTGLDEVEVGEEEGPETSRVSRTEPAVRIDYYRESAASPCAVFKRKLPKLVGLATMTVVYLLLEL